MTYGSIAMSRIGRETEKALKFDVTIETWNGKFFGWSLWLPKSVVERCQKCVDCNGSEYIDLDALPAWALEGKLPENAKEVR